MTALEISINEKIEDLLPKGKIKKSLSEVRKTLNSSSYIVEAVSDISERLEENLGAEIGGVTGKVSGKVVGDVIGKAAGKIIGKSFDVIGGLTGSVIAGTLKTVAGIIPDSSDLKFSESDKKIAHCVDTFVLPVDREALLETLQYTWAVINSKNSPFGKQTLKAMKSLNSRVYSSLMTVSNGDETLLDLAQNYISPKGIFKCLTLK